jgi:histidinol-phosphate aminotransferase
LETALSEPETVFEMVNLAQREVAYLARRLKALDFVKKVYPSEANFLFVEFDDGNYVFEQLRKGGFLVKNLHFLLPNALRISIGSPSNNRSLIDCLQSIRLPTCVV